MTTDERIFLIPGPVKGKGRPRFATRGKFAVAYTDKRTASYENLVKLCYREKYGSAAPYEAGVPLMVKIRACFPIPASWPKKRKAAAFWHTGKPDGDNIGKIVCDALNGIAWHDDGQVAVLDVQKRYVAEYPYCAVAIVAIPAETTEFERGQA